MTLLRMALAVPAAALAAAAQPAPTDYKVHFFYAAPADGVDREADRNGAIHGAIDAIQQWLQAEGGRRLRVAVDAQGKPAVGFLRLQQTEYDLSLRGGDAVDSIEAELIRGGFNEPKTLYAVFYQGRNVGECGTTPLNPEGRTRTAALYLEGEGCECETYVDGSKPGMRAFGMLHEIFHALGAEHVQGPNTDLMYEGGGSWKPSRLDPRKRYYFKPSKPAPNARYVEDSVFLDRPGGVPFPAWPLTDFPKTDCASGALRGGTGSGRDAVWINATDQWLRLEDAHGELAGPLAPFSRMTIRVEDNASMRVSDGARQCIGYYDSGVDHDRLTTIR